VQRAPVVVPAGNAALGDGDDPLDEGPQLLRARHRRLEALELQERLRLVAQHRDAMLRDTAQFAMADSMSHGSDPCRRSGLGARRSWVGARRSALE
jgi:hypothetical protein